MASLSVDMRAARSRAASSSPASRRTARRATLISEPTCCSAGPRRPATSPTRSISCARCTAATPASSIMPPPAPSSPTRAPGWPRPPTLWRVERAYLTRLSVAVGAIPSTPGGADSETAILAQRAALATLAQSDRRGCALGAALAFAADWASIRADSRRRRQAARHRRAAIQPSDRDTIQAVADEAGEPPRPSAPCCSAPSNWRSSTAGLGPARSTAAGAAGILSRLARVRAGTYAARRCASKARHSYVATDDLKVAVNAAVTLRRPLLVKGEPGTGKTILAHEIAAAIGAPLIEWHVKSTTKAHQGLYEYDAVARLRDGQLGDERVHDIANYIRKGKLWEAFTSPQLPVLLIDEIDKADIEFPNDLLQELDRMEFHVYETKETIRGRRAADRRHHLEQREGAARRLPAPLLLPLYQIPRPRDDAGDHRRPFPRHPEDAGREGDGHLLPGPRRARPQEEAVDQRADRLAEAAAPRGHAARGAAVEGSRRRRSRRSTARCSRTSRT